VLAAAWVWLAPGGPKSDLEAAAAPPPPERSVPAAEATGPQGPTAAQGWEITGRVVRRGAAVPGARVVARSDVLVEEVSTDDEGRFSLRGLPVASYLVSAALGQEASGVQGPLELGPRSAKLQLLLELLPAASVGGRVVDARTGEPIAGAHVRSASGLTVADHAGRFRLSPVPSGHSWIEASAAGFIPRTEWLTVQAAREHGGMELYLRPASRLAGRVTRLGAPVPQAQVWAEPAGLSAAGRAERYGPVLADGEGRFSLQSGTGQMRLVAAAPGGPRVDGPQVLVAEGLGRDDVLIELGEGLTAEGTVTVGGLPAQHAQVTVLDGRTQQIVAQLWTTAGGAFRVEGMAPGPYLVQAQVAAHAAQRGPFQLQSSGGAPWEIELEEGGQLRGRVEPAQAGVQVRFRAADWIGEGGAQTLTSADGSFVFPQVPSGPLRVEAEADGAFAHAQARAGDTLVLRLARSELHGYVADENGHPVTDFQLRVIPAAGGRTEVFPILHPSGEFRVEVAPGRYAVLASAAGRGDTPEPSQVEVPEGATSPTLRLTLAAALRVEGRVVDQQTQAPLEGVEVMVFRGGFGGALVSVDRSVVLVTGPDGTFRFGAVPREAGLRFRKEGRVTRWAPARVRGGAIGEVAMRSLREGEQRRDSPGMLEPYEGIGMSLRVQADRVMISGVFEGGPANVAGLLAGDQILAVDGHPVSGWPADQVTGRIMGPAGTQVRLSMRRGEQVFEVILRRRAIQL
jgi:hypothetical protein